MGWCKEETHEQDDPIGNEDLYYPQRMLSDDIGDN